MSRPTEAMRGHKHGMAEFDDISDPYVRCGEEIDENGVEIPGSSKCTHDLSQGLTAEEVMGEEDGEYGYWNPLMVATDPNAETARRSLILPDNYRLQNLPGSQARG